MANGLVSNLFIFIGGALIGSSITYLVVKNKYDKIIDEEIASVKETYEESRAAFLRRIGSADYCIG